MAKRWGRSRAIAVLGGAALGLVVACSRSGAGEHCKTDDDCESGKCALNFACAPGDCECSGDECGKVRASCAEGQVCVAGKAPFELGYNRCRVACSTDRPCGAGQLCEEGLCVKGEVFALSWVNVPRAFPCAARVPCEFAVRPSENVTVESYGWSFGGPGKAEGKGDGAAATFTYENGGTYTVRVRARSSLGSIAEIRTTEALCAGALNDACDVSTSLCCEGSCLLGRCK